MTLSFIQSLEGWWTADIEPFFTSFVSSEAQALAPIAEAGVSALESGEIAALSAGGKTTGNVLAKVVASTAAAAEAAGIAAGASSVLAAVGNAVAKKVAATS